MCAARRIPYLRPKLDMNDLSLQRGVGVFRKMDVVKVFRGYLNVKLGRTAGLKRKKGYALIIS